MIDIRTFNDYIDIDKPRRLRKYVLIWCSKGTLTTVVDEKELKLKEHEVLTITSGQIHYLKNLRKRKDLFLNLRSIFFARTIMTLNSYSTMACFVILISMR